MIACKQEHSELSGRWISTEYFDEKDFWTIDFESEKDANAYSGRDTINFYINFNINSLSSSGGYKMNLWKAEDYGYETCTVHDCDIIKITFRRDTLFVKGDGYNFFDGSFVRIDERNFIYEELFNHTGVIGRLPIFEAGDSVLNLKRALISNLNIGKGKSDPAESDSIRINVWDVYLSLNEIPTFISRQKDALPEVDRQNLKILLNADSTVGKEFLNKAINQINKADSTLKLYQSTFDYKTNKVYYRSIEKPL